MTKNTRKKRQGERNKERKKEKYDKATMRTRKKDSVTCGSSYI